MHVSLLISPKFSTFVILSSWLVIHPAQHDAPTPILERIAHSDLPISAVRIIFGLRLTFSNGATYLEDPTHASTPTGDFHAAYE